MEPITVKYKVLDSRARTPAYATSGSAAADLCAVLDEPLTVQPMQRVLVPTGLAIELPGAHAVALVYARSGLSIKHGLCMANGVGVVDSDYRGELKVPMVNLGAEAYTIQPGERVAQLCIAPVYTAAFVQADALDETARGEGGSARRGNDDEEPDISLRQSAPEGASELIHDGFHHLRQRFRRERSHCTHSGPAGGKAGPGQVPRCGKRPSRRGGAGM